MLIAYAARALSRMRVARAPLWRILLALR
jgi:hypothetical protein